MQATISISGNNITIEGIGLKELLQQVYEQGKRDGINNKESLEEIVSFQQIQSDLLKKDKKISVKTLIRKAKNARIAVHPYDGKRLAVYKKDIPKFISGY